MQHEKQLTDYKTVVSRHQKSPEINLTSSTNSNLIMSPKHKSILENKKKNLKPIKIEQL
jgi:hypothetical protein